MLASPLARTHSLTVQPISIGSSREGLSTCISSLTACQHFFTCAANWHSGFESNLRFVRLPLSVRCSW